MIKRSLIVVMVMCLSSQMWATWTVVQHKISSACSTVSSTCAVTVTSTGAGHVIVIGMGIQLNTDQIVSVSGGGTYTHPATACHGADSTVKGTDCAYTLSSTSGTTSITVTRTSTTAVNWTVAATELSFTSGPVSVDTGTPGVRDQTTTTTSPAGVTLTINGTNDAIFQMITGTTLTAVTSPYSTAVDFLTNYGFATSINSVSGVAPTWTQTSSRASLSAIAFTETVAGTVVPKMMLLGVGQ